MIDIVIPNGNEADFASMASKLGYSDLCFAYELKDFKNSAGKIAELQKKTEVKLHMTVIAEKNSIDKAMGISDFAVSKCVGEPRAFFEKKSADLVFGLELSGEKDFIYNPNSGLNQIVCRMARENDVIVGFSFSDILNAKDRINYFARLAQNIMFCNKYRLESAVASFARDPFEMRAPHDLVSFFVCFGMQPKDAKLALNSVLKRTRENQAERS